MSKALTQPFSESAKALIGQGNCEYLLSMNDQAAEQRSTAEAANQPPPRWVHGTERLLGIIERLHIKL